MNLMFDNLDIYVHKIRKFVVSPAAETGLIFVEYHELQDEWVDIFDDGRKPITTDAGGIAKFIIEMNVELGHWKEIQQ